MKGRGPRPGRDALPATVAGLSGPLSQTGAPTRNSPSGPMRGPAPIRLWIGWRNGLSLAAGTVRCPPGAFVRGPRGKRRGGRQHGEATTDARRLARARCARRPAAGSEDGLAAETPEGIRVKALYTEEDLEELAHLGTLPGLPPFVRGPRATMYAGRPLDDPPVRGVLDRRGVERLLPPQPRGGADGALGRLRPRDPPGLRFRPRARRGGCRQGRGSRSIPSRT